jgi:hypothetical protein
MPPENSKVFPAGSVAVAVTRWFAPICGTLTLKLALPEGLVMTSVDFRKICPSP